MARMHLEKLSRKPQLMNGKSGSCCLLPGKEASYFIPSFVWFTVLLDVFPSSVQQEKKSLGIGVGEIWLWSYELCTQPV